MATLLEQAKAIKKYSTGKHDPKLLEYLEVIQAFLDSQILVKQAIAVLPSIARSNFNHACFKWLREGVEAGLIEIKLNGKDNVSS